MSTCRTQIWDKLEEIENVTKIVNGVNCLLLLLLLCVCVNVCLMYYSWSCTLFKCLKHPAICNSINVDYELFLTDGRYYTAKHQCCNASAADVQHWRCHFGSLTHGYAGPLSNLSDTRKNSSGHSYNSKSSYIKTP